MLEVELLIRKPKNELSETKPIIDITRIKFPQFINYDEKELVTKIKTLTCLKLSYFKCFIVFPLLTICTAFIFLLLSIWSPKIRKIIIYTECYLDQATHLYVEGAIGNHEIVRLKNRNDEMKPFINTRQSEIILHKPLLFFTFRFIRFMFEYDTGKFEPEIFNINIPN